MQPPAAPAALSPSSRRKHAHTRGAHYLTRTFQAPLFISSNAPWARGAAKTLDTFQESRPIVLEQRDMTSPINSPLELSIGKVVRSSGALFNDSGGRNHVPSLGHPPRSPGPLCLVPLSRPSPRQCFPRLTWERRRAPADRRVGRPARHACPPRCLCRRQPGTVGGVGVPNYGHVSASIVSK